MFLLFFSKRIKNIEDKLFISNIVYMLILTAVDIHGKQWLKHDKETNIRVEK